ncbi:MAG: LysM peptidoglycan-binding domain-containing protein, partial [Gallionellaceae bacterium]|nr:LysM peptidoglycan-binding domain-containing protein [Gallionellaceae bacterium]
PVILQENSTSLLLPIDKADTFRANLESHNESLVSWQSYQSKKGERLDRVAPRFGLSLEKLKSVNGLSPRTKISNGQALLVPLRDEDANNEFEAFNMHLVPNDRLPGRTLTHTVRNGETLAGIARRYHVSTSKLQAWNSGVTQLHTGQHITIVQASKPRHAAKAGKNRTKLASAGRNHKNLAHKTPQRVHVAYSR